MTSIKTHSKKTYGQSILAIEKALGLLAIKEDQIIIRKNTEENWASVEWSDGRSNWKFQCASQDNVTQNLAALCLFIEGRVRNILRGIENKESAFAGYLRIPPPIITQKSSPYQTLGITEQASLDVVRTKYKELAKKVHPDLGGDPKHWEILKNAYDEILMLKGEDDK